MPVRRIVPNHSSLTGRLVSWKPGAEVRFESTLERDFATLLEYDRHILKYEVQPLLIRYKDDENYARRYTPDFLVHYHPDHANLKPCLFEIKYRKDLKENWKILKPKFRAALKYAKEHGWDFKILTEKEIRNDRLTNCKFLLRYKTSDHDHLMEFAIRKELEKRSTSTPQEIIDALGSTIYEKGRYLYIVWHMIAKNAIQVDLNELVHNHSIIWLRQL